MIRGLLGRRGPRGGERPIAPETPFAAIGDIHGRADLLQRLLDRLDPALPVVCVGDYVDRGDHSAEVLRLLQARGDITCLMGNHERMLLDFLNDPVANGQLWLSNGGLQTLLSFGVTGVERVHGREGHKNLAAAADALALAMGGPLVDWVAGLPLQWQSGNVAVVHAAADPDQPMDAQTAKTLQWGHPTFTRKPRADGLWVLHGHTIVDAPEVKGGRIAIDTGAFATGRLTAAVVSPEGVEFVST